MTRKDSGVKDFADLQTATTDLKIAMMESGKIVPAEFERIGLYGLHNRHVVLGKGDGQFAGGYGMDRDGMG